MNFHGSLLKSDQHPLTAFRTYGSIIPLNILQSFGGHGKSRLPPDLFERGKHKLLFIVKYHQLIKPAHKKLLKKMLLFLHLYKRRAEPDSLINGRAETLPSSSDQNGVDPVSPRNRVDSHT